MLHYKTIGNNPNNSWVVMLHGAGGSIEVWFRQVPDFARHFNLLLVDLAGHGGSVDEKVCHCLSFDKVADQVMEVVNHLGIEKAHYMGLSLGTIIARVIAENYPSRVSSMVLAGAVTQLTPGVRLLIKFADRFKYLIPYSLMKKVLAKYIIPQNKYIKSKQLFLHTAKKLSFEHFSQWLKLGDKVGHLMKDFIRREVVIPTLYLMGENDHLFLEQAQLDVANSGENVSMIIIPNAGHVCNIDNKSFFNRVSIDFFSKIEFLR